MLSLNVKPGRSKKIPVFFTELPNVDSYDHNTECVLHGFTQLKCDLEVKTSAITVRVYGGSHVSTYLEEYKTVPESDSFPRRNAILLKVSEDQIHDLNNFSYLSFDSLLEIGYSRIEAMRMNVNRKRWKLVTEDDKKVILERFPNIVADIIMFYCEIIPTPRNAIVVPSQEIREKEWKNYIRRKKEDFRKEEGKGRKSWKIGLIA